MGPLVALVLAAIALTMLFSKSKAPERRGTRQQAPRPGAVVPPGLPYQSPPPPPGSYRTPAPEPEPFAGTDMKATRLLNGTEARIYTALLQAVPAGFWVFPQVRLADIVHPVDGDRSRWQSAQNRLSLKHVDFAIVRSADRLCIGVIEVDGPHHQEQVQQQRDTVKDAALAKAGIPCIRLPARDYAPAELALYIGPALGAAAAHL